jgi:hypothetical protein
MENAWRMAAKSKVGMVPVGVWLAVGAAVAALSVLRALWGDLG